MQSLVKRMTFATAALLVGVVCTAGCDFLVSGSSNAPRDKPTGPVGPSAMKDTKKKVVAQQFVYNPIGKRDPFQSFINIDGPTSTDGPPPTGTQKYELDQYKLVGIIFGIERPRALLEDPDAVGHVAEIGTYVGRNWGKITMITSGEVVVTEEYQTIDGELVVTNISMRLPGTEGLGGSR